MAETTSGSFSHIVQNMAGLLTESMAPVFTATGDTLVDGRTKYIHRVGVVGRVQFVPVSDGMRKYTGCFDGVRYGLIRFSSATEPTKNVPLTPELGLKFLRDGRDSANLVSMHSLEGQPGNWNFFAHSFTTTLSPDVPSGIGHEMVALKFATTTNYTRLQDMAAYDQHGTHSDPARFPYLLRFVPHHEVATLFPVEFAGFPQQLASIPSGARLYDVYALDQPHGTELFVGTIQLIGALTRSKWADERLFFRHQKKENDLVKCPVWKQSIPTYQQIKHRVPLYQYPCHWILAIMKAMTPAPNLDYRSIQHASMYHPPSTWDKMVRWWFREHSAILPTSVRYDPSDGIRARHFWPLLAGRVIRAYHGMLDMTQWPDNEPDVRRGQLDAFIRENPALPTFTTPLALLEYALCNIDILDLLRHIANDPTRLVLCTMCVDHVQRKNSDRHGVTLTVLAETMRIEQLEHDGRCYSRDEIPPDIASRALWGLLSYVTGVTHLFMIHGKYAAMLTAISERVLDHSHPLRRILLPTELGATDVLISAIPPLLSSYGMPVQCFPWTVRGLRVLLRDYVAWNPLDTKSVRSQVLLSENSTVPVVGDLGRWWRYIHQHMAQVVDVLYETDASVRQDTQATQWLHETTDLVGVTDVGERASLVTVLSLVFFTQIRHHFLSNPVFEHILRWYYVLQPGPTSVGQALFSMIVYSVTSRQWVPLVGRQFEALNQHAGVRVIMTAFYEGLEPMRAFARSMYHPLALPSEMGCSTGM